MTCAERIMEVLTDEWQTSPDIARQIGVAPHRISSKMKVLSKFGLVERGEDVRTRKGHLAATWRRCQQ